MRSQIIDITRSFYPSDPASFPQNLIQTQREDMEETTFPVVAYDGADILPTSYGYRSYFRFHSALSQGTLPATPQIVLSWEAEDLRTWLIALCTDGIYFRNTSVEAPWIRAKALSASNQPWTYAILSNTLYLYRAGHTVIFRVQSDSAFQLTVQELTPTFLNMSAQQGIFQAGCRLGMWDSLNSISWSSLSDPLDFTPSAETLAGNMILNSVQGRIQQILGGGTGFLVCSTHSVVRVMASVHALSVWDSVKLLDIGISSAFHVCIGKFDYDFWVWTASGLYYVTQTEITPQIADFHSLLAPLHDSLRLVLIAGRYLSFLAASKSYFYDLELKKWGVCSAPFQCLVDLNSLNAQSATIFAHTDLGPDIGIIAPDGQFKIATTFNANSTICYGKIGFSRKQWTHFQEIRADFRFPFSGSIQVQYSIDGRNISSEQKEDFINKHTLRMYLNRRAKWMSITIKGVFDLQYLEVRGSVSGRR